MTKQEAYDMALAFCGRHAEHISVYCTDSSVILTVPEVKTVNVEFDGVDDYEFIRTVAYSAFALESMAVKSA